MNITLTPQEIEALLFAIEVTELEYEDFTNEEKDDELVADLKNLQIIAAKLSTKIA